MVLLTAPHDIRLPGTCCFYFNPFTALASNISGLNDARTRQQSVYFPVPYAMRFQCYAFLLMPVQNRRQKGLKALDFALFVGHFQVALRQ